MRPTILVLLSAILLTGCGLARKDYLTTNYALNTPTSATVGSTMIKIENGTMNPVDGNVTSFTQELIYGGLGAGVVKIAYREYGNNYDGQRSRKTCSMT